MNLMQFPKRIFEDVYLTKTIVRKTDAEPGKRARPKRVYLLIPKAMVDEQKLEPGSYICKVKRLSDAYAEEELMLTVQPDLIPEYPMSAVFPDDTGFGDGDGVYVKLKRFDIEKWFRSKKSKGFEAMTTYETPQEAE